jgi:hypothetical protein
VILGHYNHNYPKKNFVLEIQIKGDEVTRKIKGHDEDMKDQWQGTDMK